MKNPEKYSEFDWEELFREDDVMVRKYMEELPRYIHVPGEDDIVFGKGLGAEFALGECGGADNNDNDDDDDVQPRSWRDNKGADMLVKLLGLSRSWLMIQNAALYGEERRIGFRAVAALAIASGRLMAAVNACDECRTFALAHCKRVRNDLSETESLFRKIQGSRPELRRIVAEQIAALSEISEMITDWIFALRKEINSP